MDLASVIKASTSEKRPLLRAVYLRQAREIYLLETPEAALITSGCTPRALRHVRSAAEMLIRETRLSKFTVYTSLAVADKLHADVTEWLLGRRGVASLTHLRRLSALTHAQQLEVMTLIQAGRAGSIVKACAQVESPEAEESVLEQDFQQATMVALQEHFGATVIIERRNCGQVVTRNRKGAVTGVFKASQLKGAADVIVWCHGCVGIQVEFKAADGELSDDQKRHAARWHEVSGGAGYVVAQYDPALDFEVNVQNAVALVDVELGRVAEMAMRRAS